MLFPSPPLDIDHLRQSLTKIAPSGELPFQNPFQHLTSPSANIVAPQTGDFFINGTV
jgi:hypothetical protein